VSVPESRRFQTRGALSCWDVDGEALRYFFNGLPKERREDIRTHLARCRRCRRKLKVFARVWDHTAERKPYRG
jgi:hypothetical protein